MAARDSGGEEPLREMGDRPPVRWFKFLAKWVERVNQDARKRYGGMGAYSWDQKRGKAEFDNFEDSR